MHKTNDDGYCYATAPVPPSAAGVSTKPPHDGRPPQVAAQRNGYGHYQTAAGADEAGRKASNDVRRGPAAAKYAPEKPSTVSWTESKPKLEKDPQGRALNPDLGQGDAEKLFRDHVKDLYERCVRDFRALLSEVITPEVAARPTDEGKTAINSWSEAKCLLRSDPRYNKLASKDRESIWRRYADDLTRKLKQSDMKEKDKSDTDGKPRRSSDTKQEKSDTDGKQRRSSDPPRRR